MARVGEAYRACEVAAPRDLQKHRAGILTVGDAEAAVEGASPLHCPITAIEEYGLPGPCPILIGRLAAPNGDFPLAVTRTGFFDEDLFPFRDYRGGYAFEAYRADACRFADALPLVIVHISLL
jgi:hypothetical protein